MVSKKARSAGKGKGEAQTASKPTVMKAPEESKPADMARIFIMGKQYEVPRGLTIQKALEYAGMRLLWCVRNRIQNRG
jgi:hypothetical protein